jgi:hypothetical protein
MNDECSSDDDLNLIITDPLMCDLAERHGLCLRKVENRFDLYLFQGELYIVNPSVLYLPQVEPQVEETTDDACADDVATEKDPGYGIYTEAELDNIIHNAVCEAGFDTESHRQLLDRALYLIDDDYPTLADRCEWITDCIELLNPNAR